MKRRTTKELLAESFLELVQTKRIDKITITDITNNCGMSQPTFYNHFKDKYDMIVWIYTNHVREIMCKIDKIRPFCGKIACSGQLHTITKTLSLSKTL